MYVGLTGLFIDAGFGAALIQKREIDDDDVGSVFWLNVAVGVVAMAVTLLVAPWVANFFHTPELTAVLQVTSILVMINALAVVPTSLLNRQMGWRPIAITQAIGIFVGGVISVVAAMMGAGYWSIVIQNILIGLVTLIGLLLVTGVPPVRASWQRIRELWAFTWGLMGSRTLRYVNDNIDNVLVGRYLGTADLAFYALAFRLLKLPVRLLGALVNQVSLPAFSRMQDDKARMRRWFLVSTQTMATGTYPFLMLGILLTPYLIPLLFGPKWEPAVVPTQLLTAVAMRQMVLMLVGPLFQALGKTTRAVRLDRRRRRGDGRRHRHRPPVGDRRRRGRRSDLDVHARAPADRGRGAAGRVPRTGVHARAPAVLVGRRCDGRGMVRRAVGGQRHRYPDDLGGDDRQHRGVRGVPRDVAVRVPIGLRRLARDRDDGVGASRSPSRDTGRLRRSVVTSMQCLWVSGDVPHPPAYGKLIYSAGLSEALATAGVDVFGLGLVGGRRGRAVDRGVLEPGARRPCPSVRQLAVDAAEHDGRHHVAFRRVRAASRRTGLGRDRRRSPRDRLGRRCRTSLRPADRLHRAQPREQRAQRGRAQSEELASTGDSRSMWTRSRRGRLERRLLERAALVVAITDRDACRFASDDPTTPVLVLTPGYDGPRRTERTIDASTPRRAAIVTSLDWHVKQANLASFVAIADPVLAKAGVQLAVAGGAPESFAAQIRRSSRATTMLGRVDALDELMDETRIGIVAEPLGGGFKLKVLGLRLRARTGCVARRFGRRDPAARGDRPSRVRRRGRAGRGRCGG